MGACWGSGIGGIYVSNAGILKINGKLLPINFANPKKHATFAVVILYNLFYLICGLVPAKNGIAEHLGVSLFSSLYLRGLLAGKYHEWLLLCHDG